MCWFIDSNNEETRVELNIEKRAKKQEIETTLTVSASISIL